MEDLAKDFRLLDPREQGIETLVREIKKTSTNLYVKALEEMGYKLPLYVLLYNQIRYYEDFGKLKAGYSVAGKESLAEQFGVSVKQIEKAYDHLTNRYHLGNWVISDEKVFRNVKKIWVSNVRQKRGTMEDYIATLTNGENRSPDGGEEAIDSPRRGVQLPTQGSTTPHAGELPPLDDPCPKVIESNELESRKPERLRTDIVFPKLVSKFKKAGFQIINKKQLREKTNSLLDTIYEDEADVTLLDIMTAADNYIAGDWERKSLQSFLSPNVFPYCINQKEIKADIPGGYNPWEE